MNLNLHNNIYIYIYIFCFGRKDGNRGVKGIISLLILWLEIEKEKGTLYFYLCTKGVKEKELEYICISLPIVHDRHCKTKDKNKIGNPSLM